MPAQLKPGRWRHASSLDTDLMILSVQTFGSRARVEGFLINRQNGIEYRPIYFIKDSYDWTETFFISAAQMENWTPVNPP
jgi:hypothetical protein